jgi:ribosomal protein L37AE/L43A
VIPEPRRQYMLTDAHLRKGGGTMMIVEKVDNGRIDRCEVGTKWSFDVLELVRRAYQSGREDLAEELEEARLAEVKATHASRYATSDAAKSVMLYVGLGPKRKRFSCDQCGATVFTQHGSVYTCNGCQEQYEGVAPDVASAEDPLADLRAPDGHVPDDKRYEAEQRLNIAKPPMDTNGCANC